MRAGGAIESVGDSASNVLIDSNLLTNSAGPDPNTAAPGNGGGVHISGAGRVFVARGTVFNNSARIEGGGLWNSASGTLIVDGTQFNANSASGPAADNGGGAIYSDGGVTVVRNATLTENIADGGAGSGGAILSKGNLQITASNFANNAANRAGGAIETVGAGGTSIFNSNFDANRAVRGPRQRRRPAHVGRRPGVYRGRQFRQQHRRQRRRRAVGADRQRFDLAGHDGAWQHGVGRGRR